MKKTAKSTLTLNAATIRQLSPEELVQVAGAGACSVTREVSRACATQDCPGKPWTGLTG